MVWTYESLSLTVDLTRGESVGSVEIRVSRSCMVNI